jgi:Na+/H+-dicarboxylate symporter
MGRSATNVLGNAIAASVVAKTEDSLGETEPLGEVDTAKA